MTVFCADISNWQGDVDMARWPSIGIVGCIAKALEGQTGVDVKWARNKRLMAGMAGPGFVPGAYHYLNHVHPAADQCKAFLDLVPGDWIHGFDVEAPGPIDVDGWFREYRKHYPDKVVALYTNLGMWKARSKVRVFDVDAAYGPVEMWVAGAYPGQYQSGTDDFRAIWKRVPAGADGGLPFLGFTRYALMQYSGSATVPGVPGIGNCDMSVAGSLDVLHRLAAINGGTDDMSQADVDAIKAYIDQKLSSDAFLGDVAGIVWGAGVGPQGPSRKTTLALLADAADQPELGDVKALVDSALGGVTAALNGLPDAVASKLGGSADVAVVRQAVADALRENLPRFDIVAAPAPAAP